MSSGSILALSTVRRFILILGMTMCWPLWGDVVQAAPSKGEEAALKQAREKFRQAIALEAGENWTGALSLLREVASVKMTPQVRYNIALCEENLGQLVAALGDYELAAAEAEEAGADDVTKVVGPRLESLRARIPRVTIQSGSTGGQATITLDGVAIGASMVGKEMPINAGDHVVEAKGKGFRPFRREFSVTEQEKKTIEIVLEALPPEGTHIVEPTEAAVPSSEQFGEEGGGRSIVAPVIAIGVGVGSLAASGVFMGLRASAQSDLDKLCGPNRDQCPPESEDTFNKGKTYTTLANVTLGVGIAGVVTGVVLFLATGKSESKDSALSLTPAGPRGTAGASVVGSF